MALFSDHLKMKSTLYLSVMLLVFNIGDIGCQSLVHSRSTFSPSQPIRFYRGSDPSPIHRPFKSIVVTSKPFGLDNNEIERKKTTTTTASPLIKGQPTIPFFSISCTVGSSCSQIISAREVKTPMPTFKPYTKEDIAKFKGPLSSLFPPSHLKINSTAAATTTTTTEKPFRKTSHSVWRIRSTTATPSTTVKPWRNPTDWIVGLKHSNLQTADLITKKPSLHKNTAFHPQNDPETRTESTTLYTWTLPQNGNPTTESPVRKPSFWMNNKPNPQSVQWNQEQPTKSSSNEGGWISLLTSTLQHLQNRNQVSSQKMDPNSNSKKPIWNMPKEKLNPPKLEQSSPITVWNGNSQSIPWIHSSPIVSKPDPYSQSIPFPVENPSTNKKVSLITASSSNVHPVNQPKWNIPLPPEVSVSSNVIGLRVKPKSLFGPAHIEQIQGVDIETDGEDVNLTDLIMKEHLPRPYHRSIPFQRNGSRQIGTDPNDPRPTHPTVHHGFNRERSIPSSEWKPTLIFPQT